MKSVDFRRHELEKTSDCILHTLYTQKFYESAIKSQHAENKWVKNKSETKRFNLSIIIPFNKTEFVDIVLLKRKQIRAKVATNDIGYDLS